MSFGSRLKELRIEQNASQKDVANDIGISVTAISQYESNSRFPNEEILRRLCLHYKISSDYLLGLTDTKHAPLSKSEIREKMITNREMDFIVSFVEMMKDTGDSYNEN